MATIAFSRGCALASQALYVIGIEQQLTGGRAPAPDLVIDRTRSNGRRADAKAASAGLIRNGEKFGLGDVDCMLLAGLRVAHRRVSDEPRGLRARSAELEDVPRGPWASEGIALPY